MISRSATTAAFAIATLVVSAPVQAAPIFYTSEAAYLAAITADFEVNVGRDSSGAAFPASPTQQTGTNVYSVGNDVNFGSPSSGTFSSLVVIEGTHPQLGPVGSTGRNFSGSLRLDFADPATAIGFGTHELGNFTIQLYSGGVLLSSTPFSTAGGFAFLGVQELLGFDALVISTSDTFWSIDGGRLAAGLPASSTRMMGELARTSVPEPASMLLLGTGLLGAGVRRWRQKRT